MNLLFENSTDNSHFSLSNFTCTSNHEFLGKKNNFRIIWARSGELTIKVDGIKYQLTPNQIAFLTPLNSLDFVLEDQEIIAISFNREFYCIDTHDEEVSCHGLLFFGSAEIQIIDLEPEEQRSFGLLYGVLKEEFENKDHIQGEMLRMLLKRWIIKSTRLARSGFANPEITQLNLDVVRKFNVLVEMNFREMHKVAEYADLLFKSPKTLSNLFAQYNSKSPLQVINDRIILEASRLLVSTDKTVKEIAYELGYSDIGHFSKFFKKNTNLGPSEYRKAKSSLN